MKTVLLPPVADNVRYFRASLHGHSTLSDGRKTPAELKELYKNRGYHIVAYTDHRKYIPHNDLTEDDFLALGGFELDFAEPCPRGFQYIRACHICMLAPTPDTPAPAFLPDYGAQYDHAHINALMAQGAAAGFFVTYNHPTWSHEFYLDYTAYRGMHAMEMYNNGTAIEGYDTGNGHIYDDLLHSGNRIFCIASDDNHNAFPPTHPKFDSFGGYTMIAAPSLDYPSVIDALKRGQFYACTGSAANDGPVIKSLVYENGVVTIETSPAAKIFFLTESRSNQTVFAKDGVLLTRAEFPRADREVYFRIVVTDENGFCAYTNAYFPDGFSHTNDTVN